MSPPGTVTALPASRADEERGAREAMSLRRILAEQAFSRAGGAPLVPGNAVRLLRDAAENYPAWLEAITAAERTVHFESYIIHEDETGRQFAELLAAKARDGVRVRVIYDWLGGLGHASRRFWRALRQAGVEVRCFNPPRFDSPFGWLSRDHRKVIVVDGRIAFVTGLCVGQRWVGDPARGVEPWRDTGIEIRGPAVADVEYAFGQTWALTGAPIPEELPTPRSLPVAGDVPLRVIATIPATASLYRLDQLIAAMAQRTLWLTDAYFVGVTGYVQGLRAAVMDGVDVRLLVPGATDIPIVRAVSRAGYRPLLEAGIRVFEWNGPMLHAKTAVADGHWARVGSTNLNLASWIGNWELDVAVEDDRFGHSMQQTYLEDLRHSSEIVLQRPRRVHIVGRRSAPQPKERGQGSAGRAAAGAIGIGNMIGAAITNHRALGPAEARLTAFAGLALLLLAVLAVLWPRLVVVPFAGIGIWISVALLVRAWRLWRAAHRNVGSHISS
jgi:cardiolipin synthase